MVTTLGILKIFVEGTLAHSLTTKRHQWAALRHHCWVRWHQILTESLTTWAVCGSLQNKMTMMSLIKQVFRFLRYYDSYGVRSQLIPTKMIVEYCRCYSLSLQGSTKNVLNENEFVGTSCFTLSALHFLCENFQSLLQAWGLLLVQSFLDNLCKRVPNPFCN